MITVDTVVMGVWMGLEKVGEEVADSIGSFNVGQSGLEMPDPSYIFPRARRP
jgi:hypothetical protein